MPTPQPWRWIDPVRLAVETVSRQDKDQAEVFDLAGLIRLMDWYKALAIYDRSGDFGAFPDLLRKSELEDGAVKSLKTASFMERTSREMEASTHLKGALKSLRGAELDATAQLFRKELIDRLSWCQEELMSERQKKLAIEYLNRGDYLRATIFGFEAFISKVVEGGEGDPTNMNERKVQKESFENGGMSDEYRLLRAIRNLMAHGNIPVYGRIGDRANKATKPSWSRLSRPVA